MQGCLPSSLSLDPERDLCSCCPTSAMRSHCVAAPQNLGQTNDFRARVVLAPQRKGFGLCGIVPSLLLVDAWSEEDNISSYLIPGSDDIFKNISLANIYGISSAQAGPLDSCPGALWGFQADWHWELQAI